MKKSLLAAAALSVLASNAFAETNVPQSAVKNLSVTVYNNGLGLVKDTRGVPFEKGTNTVSFAGVSAQIQPETALFSGDGVRVVEQNFNFDLLNRQSLLQKFLGKQIKVVSTNPATGQETTEDATVLSAADGVVLKIGDRIETDSKARLIFPDVPATLRDKPTLTVDLLSDKAGARDVNLSYLTNGLTWRADYVAELNDTEDSIDLNGWVTLTNDSGADYKNADMQFVAGSVNRVRPMTRARPMMMMAKAAAVYDSVSNMAEEELMDYHLYSLGRKTDILSNQTKQLALLSGSNIQARKEYRFDDITPVYSPRQKEFDTRSAAIYLQFVNDKKSNLGMALPAGTMRVYKADSKQRIFFVGEDRIKHTPENEKIKLALGEAFDVTAKGKQTAYTQFSPKAYEASYEITFQNAKNVPVTVYSYQSLPDGWTITNNSATYTKENAGQVLWQITVPTKGKTVLTYTVRVKGE